MRRRLLALNLALLAASVLGIWRLRVEYRRAVDRYRILQPPPAAAATLPAAQATPMAAAQAASYLDAAQKYLLSPDRNPTVVVAPPKVKPKPPLPQLFGVMSIGGGPTAFFAVPGAQRQKAVRLGETIGEFKLVAVASDQIELEWEGEKFQAQVSELMTGPAREQAPAASGATGGANAGGTLVGDAAINPPGAASSATPVNPAASGRPGDIRFGPEMQTATGTVYQAAPGETSPHGTVHQGKRKVVRQTPFGQQAWWEDIKP